MVSRKSKSKKQSDANSTLKQLENIVLFIDRSLGKNVIPSALRNAGAKVEIHDDHLSSGWQMADIFVKALPAMIRFLKKNNPPFIAKISRSSKITPA